MYVYISCIDTQAMIYYGNVLHIQCITLLKYLYLVRHNNYHLSVLYDCCILSIFCVSRYALSLATAYMFWLLWKKKGFGSTSAAQKLYNKPPSKRKTQ